MDPDAADGGAADRGIFPAAAGKRPAGNTVRSAQRAHLHDPVRGGRGPCLPAGPLGKAAGAGGAGAGPGHFAPEAPRPGPHGAGRAVYTGVLVQGKRTTPNYKTKKFVYRNEDEWVRVEGTHEAIISRPQFDLVQKLLLEDTRAGAEDTAVHPYCGRIFCADCGAPAVRKTVRSGDRQYVYYVCSANKSNREACSINKN